MQVASFPDYQIPVGASSRKSRFTPFDLLKGGGRGEAILSILPGGYVPLALPNPYPVRDSTIW